MDPRTRKRNPWSGNFLIAYSMKNDRKAVREFEML
jgi:hypothetical protein